MAANPEPWGTRTPQERTDVLLAELQDALDALHAVRLRIAEWEQQRADSQGGVA